MHQHSKTYLTHGCRRYNLNALTYSYIIPITCITKKLSSNQSPSTQRNRSRLNGILMNAKSRNASSPLVYYIDHRYIHSNARIYLQIYFVRGTPWLAKASDTLCTSVSIMKHHKLFLLLMFLEYRRVVRLSVIFVCLPPSCVKFDEVSGTFVNIVTLYSCTPCNSVVFLGR